MISANELRVGNLLQGNQIVKVTAILEKKSVKIEGSISTFSVEGKTPCLKPIPLTEDILLKCGFEKRVDNTLNEAHFVLGKFIVRDDFVLCDIDIHVVITTLHQLQNLYFALTGEELNVEL